ncbi:MAG: glycosyltransferase family 2 protein [Gemmatimonas sp.]|jgi:glycosyltransferase involved in cell wall biosynthesis|uniref:glycosyltransferase family 2 protein n=1 Tax=Gemmatimonas sp. TaxID=1962908 RepID=UPI0025B82BF4|nr:glycosyltransferase family A protein [Gemmatimonas sp.]MCA2986006.1 glycosyltransferase family 2 protein [Gemmatimonas sp.]
MGNSLRTEGRSVSVVIPAFRAAAFLGEAIASVRAQTVQPGEVIVVDDCSPDDTVAVARTLDVTLVESTSNGGSARARNIGIARASGSIVAFLDADDMWHPRHLELSLRALDESGAILCSSRTTTGDVFPPIAETSGHQHFAERALLAHMLGPNPVAQTTCVLRREPLQRVGGYQDGERHAEDYQLWLRLATQGSFALLDAVTCRYRLHPGQTSRASVSMFEKAWEHRLRAFREWQAQFGDRFPTLEQECLEALDHALAVDLTAVWYDLDRPARDFFEGLADRTPELRPIWNRQLATREAWPLARLRKAARQLLRADST